MSYTADAADQMMRIILTTGEITLRLTASLLKNAIALIAALAKRHKKVCGKTRLTKLLQTTRELRCCPIPLDQYQAFRSYAKRYGIQYAVIKDKLTGTLEIVCAESEMDRVNRVFHLLMPQVLQEAAVPPQPVKPQEETPRRSMLERLEECREVCGREERHVPVYEREEELTR